MKIGIIGGGVMGLTAAYELAKQGGLVTLFEKQDDLGGLAGSFDWYGVPIEKYYHFICLPDKDYVGFLKELGLESRLRWRSTRMAYFYNGKLYRWGDPLSLFLFPGISLMQKLRYGMNVLYSKYSTDWKKIENISAERWLRDWLGEDAFDIFWKTLLNLKFGDKAGQVSAAWIWSRIKRVANSRKGFFKECYGFIEGGTKVFINAVAEKIKLKGGEIELSTPVREIVIKKGRVEGIRTNKKEFKFDIIISTVPLPELLKIKSDLPPDYFERLSRIKNIGIVCALFLLKKPLTENFWLNIKDPHINLPGLIEYTNLNDLAYFENMFLVYVPQYISALAPRFLRPDNEILDEYFSYLKMIRPDLKDSDLIAFKVFRDPYAQPIPEKGFSKMLPDMRTPISNLLIADSSFYFPEDRTIDQSIMVGKKLARLVKSKI